MSCCGPNGQTCGSCPECTEVTADAEPLQSALENFITQFFGVVTKTVVDDAVIWTLPCDLSSGLPNNPRQEGEGLACYFLRLFSSGIVGLTGPRGNPGETGASGQDAFSLTTEPFAQPDVESCPNVSVTVEDGSIYAAEMNVFIAGSGYYTVVEVSGNTLFLNLDAALSGGAAHEDVIAAGVAVLPVGATGPQGVPGPRGLQGEQGIQGNQGDAGDDGEDGQGSRLQLLEDFVQPAVNGTVTVTVDRAEQLDVGQYLYIDNGGYYRVTAVTAPTITIENQGVPGSNVSPGSPIGPSVGSPAYVYLTGYPGSEGSVFTTTSALFAAPAVGSTVSISVESTVQMLAGQKVYIENGGYYEVVSIGGATSITGRRLFGTPINASGNIASGNRVYATEAPAPIASEAVLSVGLDHSLTGSVFANNDLGSAIGLEVTLPTAGTYLVIAKCRVLTTSAGTTEIQLYDTNAALEVEGSISHIELATNSEATLVTFGTVVSAAAGNIITVRGSEVSGVSQILGAYSSIVAIRLDIA